MTQIYEKSSDLHIRATCIYVKSNDDYAYLDAAQTTKIDALTLHNIFQKGMIIIDGTMEYKPTSFIINAGVGTVTYITADDVTPTTAVLATLKSSEYVAG